MGTLKKSMPVHYLTNCCRRATGQTFSGGDSTYNPSYPSFDWLATNSPSFFALYFVRCSGSHDVVLRSHDHYASPLAHINSDFFSNLSSPSLSSPHIPSSHIPPLHHVRPSSPVSHRQGSYCPQGTFITYHGGRLTLTLSTARL